MKGDVLAMEQEQRWVDPTPASLYLVFVTALSLWAFFTGRMTADAAPLLGALLFGFGILWFIAGIVNFRMGDLLGGTINAVFGALLGISPGISFLFVAYAGSQGIAVDPRVNGWLLILTGICFIPLLIGVAKRLWILCLTLLVLGSSFIIIGLIFAGYVGLEILPVPGWMLFAGGISMFYIASAIIINTSYAKPLLPLGGPLVK